MANSLPIVAIDGPTGSGKGTISRQLARMLGWHLLDSGALYRLVALAAVEEGISIDDSVRLVETAVTMDIGFSSAEDDERIFFNGIDVTAQIRTEKHGGVASKLASQPAVRLALLERQRAFVQVPGLVADGRDMGSVVFPDALLKVFLTATPDERAKRRHNQLKEKGIDVSLPALSREIAERDERDVNRKVAPLKPAEGARILDSTGMTPNQVVARLRAWLEVRDGSA